MLFSLIICSKAFLSNIGQYFFLNSSCSSFIFLFFLEAVSYNMHRFLFIEALFLKSFNKSSVLKLSLNEELISKLLTLLKIIVLKND